MADVRLLIDALRKGSVTPPAPQVVEFSARAGTLSPHELDAEATALIEGSPTLAESIARVTCDAFEALLGDLAEHGKQAEYADDAAFVRAKQKAWKKRSRPGGTPGEAGSQRSGDSAEAERPSNKKRAGAAGALDAVLRDPRLVEATVAAIEHMKLPDPEVSNGSRSVAPDVSPRR